MTTRRTDRRNGPARRDAILTELRAATAPLSIADLAAALQVHPNTVRFHLDALSTEGYVEACIDTRGSVGRPRRLYRPVHGVDRDTPTNYRLLAEVIVEELSGHEDAAARAEQIGQRWGRARATSAAPSDEPMDDATARARLMSLLTDLEFAPAVGTDEDDGTSTIGLRHCPFLDAAREHGTVVCAIHLGLMRGVLDAWDTPLAVTSLEPFRTPGLCVAHLSGT